MCTRLSQHNGEMMILARSEVLHRYGNKKQKKRDVTLNDNGDNGLQVRISYRIH